MQKLSVFSYLCTMKKSSSLRSHLKPGKLYRRADLEKWSTAVDRHLGQLTMDGTLEKLSGGLYYVPKQSAFGKAPANDDDLVKAFLKDNRFVVTSPNDYNSLGVGTTQLYNTRKVYNHKRHGNFRLGNRNFDFVRRPYVPAKVTKEFLLVDLVNNLKHLAEDQPALMDNVKKKAKEMDVKRLKQLVSDFGTVATKHTFESILG